MLLTGPARTAGQRAGGLEGAGVRRTRSSGQDQAHATQTGCTAAGWLVV